MELATKTGLKAVEFWDWFGRDWEALLAKKEEYGLEVTAICSKDRNNLDDPAQREKAVAGLKETIEVAKKFHCPNIIVTAGEKADVDRTAARDSIVAGLKAMAPYAEEAGITLVLEPISGGYFRDSAEPFAILDEVGSPNVKLLYDIFHYQIMEGNIVETIRANIDKIGHFHAACVPGRNEITKGELDYRFIFREIEKAGYKGYVGMEYLPVMDKEESVRDFMNLMENL
jgi:hydroxypyruvate isomerase